MANKPKRQSAGGVVAYAFLALYALVIIVPLLFIVFSSFKTNEELFDRPWSLPAKLDFFSYYDVLINFNLYRYFFNSLFYSAFSVIISLVVCSMGAYAIIRLKWRLRGLCMGFLLLGLMVPSHALVVPLYIFIAKLGISSQRINLIVIFVAFSVSTSVFILSGYLKSIPWELEEAAVIDGCSLYRSFVSIIVPIITPALSTVAIFNFLNVWTDFFISLIFINDQKQWTIQLGINMFKGSFATRYSYLLIAVILAIIPSVVVYMIFNKKIVAGVTAGALKA
jgi:raffinose/stachyose/melibiose transport system permease protein